MSANEILEHLKREIVRPQEALATVTCDPIGIAIPFPEEISPEAVKEVETGLVHLHWRFEILKIQSKTHCVFFPF